MRRTERMLRGVVLVGGLSLAGCLPYTEATERNAARFEHLHRRDLSAFERALAVEEHLGSEDAWSRVGEAWLALASCRPVDRKVEFGGSSEAPVAAVVHGAVAVEDARRRLETARRIEGAEATGVPRLVDRLREPDFFERAPGGPESGTVRWPAERETWADETPAAIEVEGDCEGLAGQVREGPPPVGAGEADGDRRVGAVEAWRVALLRSIGRLVDRYERLPEAERSGSVAEVYWRARLYGATRAHRFAERYRDESLSAERDAEVLVEELDPERLVERTREWLEAVVREASPASEHLDGPELARASALAARLEASREEARSERVVALVDRALELGVEGANRRAARYLKLRTLVRRGRWEEAGEFAGELPPRESRYYEAFAYRLGVALRQLERDDRFLGLAKEVFRAREPRDDPFSRALYGELLQLMARYEFESRVVELLEEVGPRSGTYRRIEEFARVCLTRGRLENAEAAARWLLRRHDDARFTPRYRGLLALVAFHRDDPEGFRRQIGELTDRPEELLEAIAPHRRARFFAPADSALAGVMRRMLPAMAEWGDAPGMRARRRRWLEIVVDETQRFLRETEESAVRSRLEELYRMASSLLDEHPRGYAERVGSEQPAPLVLGTVEVGAGRLASHEPGLAIEFAVPYSLTLIPRDDRPPSDWELRWPPNDEGTSDA